MSKVEAGVPFCVQWLFNISTCTPITIITWSICCVMFVAMEIKKVEKNHWGGGRFSTMFSNYLFNCTA